MAPTSPRRLARLIGGLALALVVLGPFSMMYVPTVLVVPGDANATAHNIASSEWLFRCGIASDLGICLIEVVLLTLLYALMKPVNAAVARIATVARLAMAVVQGVNVTFSLAVLLLVGHGAPVSTLTAEQSSALAQVMLALHEQVVHIWEVFFALHCLLVGLLIFRAGFVPKWLGPLMVMAAFGYFANGVGNLLHPGSKQALASLVALTSIFGELPFFLWLTIKAVDADAWQRLAAQPAR